MIGRRIGLFFFLVGLLVLFVFAASLANETPQFNLLLITLATMLPGIYLMVKNRKPPGEAARFRRIRKLRSKKKE